MVNASPFVVTIGWFDRFLSHEDGIGVAKQEVMSVCMAKDATADLHETSGARTPCGCGQNEGARPKSAAQISSSRSAIFSASESRPP